MAEVSKYRIQDIFDSYEDYILYLKKTYSLFQDLKQSKDPSFSKIVPEYLEIEFIQTLKAPRLYYPRNKGVIIVQLPLGKSAGLKQKEALRSKALITFSAIVKINEKAMAEEFAMSLKLFESE